MARELLGRILVREEPGDAPRTSGRIVETEAYTGLDDPASHAAARIGRTARNDPLYGPPGIAYIHQNYGIHWLLNVVTTAEGQPEGVLIRAVEPLDGLERMRSRRGGRAELTNGPGRLTQAFGIGPELQRHRLTDPPLWIEPGEPVPDAAVERTARIGISRAADRPYRFVDRRSEWLSR